MNIEEAIQQLKKHKAEIDEKYISARYSKAIETLLTAYEEEKEKNKKEYDKGYKDGYVKGVQPQIFENWKKANAKVVNIESKFISKDKIKAKIEELKEVFDMGEEWYNKNYIIEVLQSLLEKE